MESQPGREGEDRFERLMRAVRQVMAVQDVTSGRPEDEFAVRFRGRLLFGPEAAYEQLRPSFDQEGMTLLFREQDGAHAIIGVPGRITPTASNPWINLILFLATLLSVILAGVLYAYDGPPLTGGTGEMLRTLLGQFPRGLSFAASLLAILLAHEFGHYLAARYHKTSVTLPYFLPFPGSLFGTLGAFIRMKEPPRDRRILLDIGLAGPLAGLIVALPILLVGLYLSPVDSLPARPVAGSGMIIEGNSVLYLGLKYLVKGELLPAPASYGGLPPALYWLRYFLLGLPAPLGGRDVLLHPMAWAGWAGLLVTALNLMPVGQLDGGHLVYVLLGDQARRFWPVVLVALVAFGLVWQGWWLWAVLIFFLGRTYAQPLDEITPLGPGRKAFALLGLLLFILTFTPVPLSGFLGG